MKFLKNPVVLVLIIIFVIATIAFHIGKRIGTGAVDQSGIATPDSSAIAAKIKSYQDALAERDNRLARWIGLEREGHATGHVAKPAKNPLGYRIVPRPILGGSAVTDMTDFLPSNVPDTNWHFAPSGIFKAPLADAGTTIGIAPCQGLAYDLPMYGTVSDDAIEFLTYNDWLSRADKPYLKSYRFPREGDSFEWTAKSTTDTAALDGIKLVWKRQFFKFDGFGITGSWGRYGDPNILGMTWWSFGVDARAVIWQRLELSPSFERSPETNVLKISGRVRL